MKHARMQLEPSARPTRSFSRLRSTTIASACAHRLETLCRAAGMGDETAAVLETFERLVVDWRDLPVGPREGWTSDISDDNTPIELSAAISEGRVQVRVLLEAQAPEPTVAAHRRAAIELTERLERELGADLSRFRVVADIFLPDSMQGPFALWHSAVFERGRPPTFKAYFNPQARGSGHAQALVEEALSRLGLEHAWASICASAARGPHLDELKYFALDLVEDAHARVKVYVRHHDASAEDLENACSHALDYSPGEVREFVRAMGGDRERLAARATFTCSAFVGGHARPSATTVYVPICAYAPHDEAVRARVRDYLARNGLDPATYERLITGYAHRPLDAGVGMQSWVAFRRMGAPRLTVYLATELARVHPPGSVPAETGDRRSFPSPEAVLRCVSEYDIGQHPLVRRMLREGDVAAVRELAAGLRELTSDGSASESLEEDGAGAAAARLAGDLAAAQIAAALGEDREPRPDPFGIAREMPASPEAILAIRRSAMSIHAVLWRSLDELYVKRLVAVGTALSSRGRAAPRTDPSVRC